MNNKHPILVMVATTFALSACALTETTSTTSASLDAATPDITLNRFIDVRMASLRQEAAAGEGENIDALAELMGRDPETLGYMLQENYMTLFDSLETSDELIARIERLSPQT